MLSSDAVPTELIGNDQDYIGPGRSALLCLRGHRGRGHTGQPLSSCRCHMTLRSYDDIKLDAAVNAVTVSRKMGRKTACLAASLQAPLELIERRIYLARGRKVMFDRDLAEIYEVERARWYRPSNGMPTDSRMTSCSSCPRPKHPVCDHKL